MAPPRDNINNTDMSPTHEPTASPYSNKLDPMSNVSSFKIIESTLRGMQCYFYIQASIILIMRNFF